MLRAFPPDPSSAARAPTLDQHASSLTLTTTTYTRMRPPPCSSTNAPSLSNSIARSLSLLPRLDNPPPHHLNLFGHYFQPSLLALGPPAPRRRRARARKRGRGRAHACTASIRRSQTPQPLLHPHARALPAPKSPLSLSLPPSPARPLLAPPPSAPVCGPLLIGRGRRPREAYTHPQRCVCFKGRARQRVAEGRAAGVPPVGPPAGPLSSPRPVPAPAAAPSTHARMRAAAVRVWHAPSGRSAHGGGGGGGVLLPRHSVVGWRSKSIDPCFVSAITVLPSLCPPSA